MAPRRRNTHNKRNANLFSGKRKRMTRKTQPKGLSISKTMVMYKNPKQQLPFPPTYRTSMRIDLDGYIPLGSLNGQYFCRANGILTPFNSGGWLPAGLGAATQPAGLSTIFEGVTTAIYRNSRVLSSTFRLQPFPGQDLIQWTVTPSINDTVPATVTAAMAQPWTKSLITDPAFAVQKNNVLRNTISLHKFMGVSSQALKNDLSGNYGGSLTTNPNVQFYWVLNWVSMDGANTIGQIPYKVSLIMDIEFYNQNYPSLGLT